jgi:sugar phosphate isomerase/epimerase
MNLSISSLAWQANDLERSLATLKRFGVSRIEGVFTKIDTWEKINRTIVSDFCDRIATWSITMPSIQSIFYGSGLKTFADEQAVSNHLRKVCELAHVSKSKILVLGAPSLRKPDTRHCLTNSLASVSKDLVDLGIKLCIEPNSRVYGGDYYCELGEICEFVRNCKIDGICAMLDTHNLELEGYDPLCEYVEYMDCIQHIHISSKNLEPINDFSRYKIFAKELKRSYNGLVTYELSDSKDFENHVLQFVDVFSN